MKLICFIRKILVTAVICSLIVALPAGKTAAAFTVGDERDVGEKLLYSVRSAFPLLDDPDLTQYVTDIGREVLAVAGIQFFDYHFFVIQSDEFNAFAAPSGLVFFYSGLIGSMKNEDEFISVLAHEIAHVSKRHLASRMEKSQIVSIASLGMAIAALALGGGGAASQSLFVGSLAAGQSAQLHFSRENEEEADLVAYDWMKKMQRDPVAQKKMLETMRRIARYRSERLPQYLLTHPETENRLEYVSSLIETNKDEQKSHGQRDNFRFLRFKYRILAASKDTTALRTSLATTLSDSKSSKEEILLAKFGLAEVEKNDSNFDKSRKLLDEVIAGYPDKQILKTDKGVLELTAGRVAEAKKLLEESVAADKNDLLAVYTLGKVYMSMNDMKKAEQLFLAVKTEIPEYAKVYFELGKIASARQQQGLASVYLGKYDLYEGKLKLARQNIRLAMKAPDCTDQLRKESEEMIKLLDKLEKR